MENQHVESSDFDTTPYSMVEVLGNGSFGKVFLCEERKTGREVAVKVPLAYSEEDRNERRFLRRILERGDPDKVHIVKLLGFTVVRGIPSIVLEYLTLSLMLYLSREGRMRISQVRCLGIQLFTAINFLKSCCIVHSDIKPSNIMVAGLEGEVVRVKLIDFGGFEVDAVPNPPKVWETLTSCCYRSPEVVMGLPASFPIDVWSVTVVLLESLVGKIAFPAKSNRDLATYFHQVFGNAFLHPELLAGRYARKYTRKDSGTGGFVIKDKRDRPARSCPFGYNFEGLSKVFKDETPAYQYDTAHFIDFLKVGLCPNPRLRITAEGALQMSFFTLDHFPFDESDHEEDAFQGVKSLL